MTVAMTAVAGPIRNTRASGSRYVYVGRICMKSRTGVMIASKRRETPDHTPSGMPMTSETSTATSVRARVSMLSCHRPCRPMKVKPATASRATRALPQTQEKKPMIASTPSQPMIGSGRVPTGWEIRCCIPVTSQSMNARISLKK